MSGLQAAKLQLVSLSGLPKDALHVYVGLAIFLAATALSKKRFHSPVPWLLVLAAVAAGELWDAYDNIRSAGHWRWQASWHDAWNTLLWPSVILVLGRAGMLGNRRT